MIVSLRMAPELAARLDEAARAAGTSRSKVILAAIRAYLDDQARLDALRNPLGSWSRR